jgi:uncharacterized protein involved in cysteine biosynthesis
MLQALFLSIGQLFDRRVAAVFLKSFLLTLMLLGAVAVAVWLAMHRMTHWLAYWLGSWLDSGSVADIATIAVVLLAHLLLFRVVAIAVIGVFADDVVEAVEAKHYPAAHAKVRHVPLHQSARMGLGSGGRAILFNLIFSPVYLIALPAAPFIFFIVNAWLLGRDLGDMVAVRHMPERDLASWRRRTRLRRLALGSFGTALLLIPGIAFLAPVLGAAMAAHIFHGGRK